MPQTGSGPISRDTVANAKSTLADAKDTLNSLKDDLRSSARKAGGAVRSRIDDGEEQVRRLAEKAGDRLEYAHDALADRIRERPLVYAGGAVAAGMLIGLILSARRS